MAEHGQDIVTVKGESGWWEAGRLLGQPGAEMVHVSQPAVPVEGPMPAFKDLPWRHRLVSKDEIERVF